MNSLKHQSSRCQWRDRKLSDSSKEMN